MLKGFFDGFDNIWEKICFCVFIFFLILALFVGLSFIGSIFVRGYIDGYDVVDIYYISDDDNVYRLDSLGFYDSVSLSHADIRYKPGCNSYSYVLKCQQYYRYSWMDFLFFNDYFYLYTDTLE